MDQNEEVLEAEEKKSSGRSIRGPVWFLVCCAVLAVTILLTYTLTAESVRNRYVRQILTTPPEEPQQSGSRAPTEEEEKIAILADMVKQYSYYADTMSEEEMLTAAFRAYVAATGDRYAAYYTPEEYQALLVENSGILCGIGVSVRNTLLVRDGSPYYVFHVLEVYENAPAAYAGIMPGDDIDGVEIDGEIRSINELGYDAALAAIRGEEGTEVKIRILRGEEQIEYLYTVKRERYETKSVRASIPDETKPDVGLIRIASFEETTPKQFKEAMKTLKDQGVVHFIFDVRDNPGGNLLSIGAVLTYFLQDGDLILEARNKDDVVEDYYTAGAVSGYSAEAYNVKAEEVGMYAGTDMVVLCNENTASAAEVFVATMRDYGFTNAIVGEKTFGKGIMQTTQRISYGDSYAYVKLTTHAYVTKCGVSYHDIGIDPTLRVVLNDGAEYCSAEDNQLTAAIAAFDPAD